MAAKKNAKTDNHEGKFLIRLPKNKYQNEDVAVSVNGRTTLIKRGVAVWVSPAVKEVLDNNEKMEAKVFERMEAAEKEYEDSLERYKT